MSFTKKFLPIVILATIGISQQTHAMSREDMESTLGQENPLHKIVVYGAFVFCHSLFMDKHPELKKFVNELDKDGNTPLHCVCKAAFMPETEKITAKKLLELGANPNAKNLENKKPRELSSCKEVQLILLKAEQEAKERKNRN